MSKKLDKMFCLLMLCLLTLAVFSVHSANAQETTVYIDPPSIIDQGLGPGSLFNITVMVSDIQGFYGWQVEVLFDGALLNVTRCIYPSDHVFAGKPYMPLGPVIDNETGSVFVGATLMGTAAPFDGTGKLIIIEFQVEGLGHTDLEINESKTKLLDTDLQLIPYTATDGYFENTAPPPPAHIYVDPEDIIDPTLTPCNNFELNISIANATGIYGFEFKLSFDPTVLQAVDAVLGTFFPPSVTPEVTIDNTTGYIQFRAELSPPEEPKNGDGTLATITFHVESVGVSDLTLYDTVLWDDNLISLPHTTANGFFRNIAVALLYIQPPEIIDPELLPGAIFTVDVELDDVDNMYGYEFKLGYNTHMLTCIGILVHPVFNETHFTTYMQIDDSAGMIWVKVDYYPPANPITTYTPVSIVTLTFMIDHADSSVLDLYDTNITDSDGLPIPHEATDGYVQTEFHDVAITNIVCSHTWAYAGWIVNVTVTAKNLGNVSETFDVTAFYDNNTIGTMTVTDLPPNAETELTFMWNTTDVEEAIYTLRAEASQVPYESNFNLTNNFYEDGTIEIRRLVRDVAIVDVYPDVNAAYPGWTVNITVIARNEGNVSETFDVTAFYDNNTIDTQTVVDLLPNEEIVLTFLWNTTELEPCNNFTISAEASPVPYEVDLADNFYENGHVKIKLWGDINNDGKVDIIDIVTISVAFGSYPGHPRWNPDADINRDQQVDIMDVTIAAANFGKSC